MNKRNKPKKNKQTSNQKINNSNKQPSGINSPEKESSSDNPENHTNEKKDKSISNRGLLWVNIGMLLAFVTVNYFLITNSERNAKTELRAFVNVKMKTNIIADSIKNMLTIECDIMNTGKTPAYKVRAYVITSTRPFRKTQLDSIKLPFTSFTIGAGETHGQAHFVELPHKEVIDVYNGKLAIYFAIKIAYTDFWKQSHFVHGNWRIGKNRITTEPIYNDAN